MQRARSWCLELGVFLFDCLLYVPWAHLRWGVQRPHYYYSQYSYRTMHQNRQDSDSVLVNGRMGGGGENCTHAQWICSRVLKVTSATQAREKDAPRRWGWGRRGSWLVSYLVFWPSQPLGIISVLKKTVIKRYIVERTNKADIRPEEQSQ